MDYEKKIEITLVQMFEKMSRVKAKVLAATLSATHQIVTIVTKAMSTQAAMIRRFLYFGLFWIAISGPSTLCYSISMLPYTGTRQRIEVGDDVVPNCFEYYETSNFVCFS